MKTVLWLVCLSLCSALVMASPSVRVVGLFKGSALLEIDGRQRLLKQGATSPEGVKLIDADSKGAEVQWQGTSMRLRLDQRIASGFTESVKSEVAIPRNRYGQYITSGNINGKKVRLLVDTGATLVAMNAKVAKQLDIPYRSDGRLIRVSTASGTVDAYEVWLRSVTVGDIHVSHVRASVIAGSHPTEILLGMTFLDHVQLSERPGILVMTAKH